MPLAFRLGGNFMKRRRVFGAAVVSFLALPAPHGGPLLPTSLHLAQ